MFRFINEDPEDSYNIPLQFESEVSGFESNKLLHASSHTLAAEGSDGTDRRLYTEYGGEKLTKGKQKISIEFIRDRTKRYSTFSKRKTGLMKKAVELAELTGAEVLLLIASETNHVYTYATQRLRGIIDMDSGKELIQTCLSSRRKAKYDVPIIPDARVPPSDHLRFHQVREDIIEGLDSTENDHVSDAVDLHASTVPASQPVSTSEAVNNRPATPQLASGVKRKKRKNSSFLQTTDRIPIAPRLTPAQQSESSSDRSGCENSSMISHQPIATYAPLCTESNLPGYVLATQLASGRLNVAPQFVVPCTSFERIALKFNFSKDTPPTDDSEVFATSCQTPIVCTNLTSSSLKREPVPPAIIAAPLTRTLLPKKTSTKTAIYTTELNSYTFDVRHNSDLT